MKHVNSKIALFALFAGITAAGCSSEQAAGNGDEGNTDPSKGSVNFNLLGQDQNGTEYTIDTLHVVITDSADAVIFDDDIEVSGPEDTASLSILLPVGSDYSLVATATGAGSTDVNGDGTPDPVSVPCVNADDVTFDIGPGPNPAIELAMSCDVPSPDTNTGSATIDATFTFEQGEACGLLTMLVGPLSRPLGGVIDTEGTGTSDVTAYLWSQASTDGGSGSFGDVNAADTSFTCTSAGNIDITLTVTNVADQCEDSHTVSVDCTTAFVCGDNVQDPGEDCDGTDTDPGRECTSTCDFVECGDGVQEGSEECDEGDTASNDGCGPTCLIEECGDGIVNNGVETCDPPGSPVSGGVCLADCTSPQAQSCEECTASVCGAQVTACADANNNGFTAVGVTGNRCEAAVDCMETVIPATGEYCITYDGDTDTLSCACPEGMNALDCASGDVNYPPFLGNADLACLTPLRRAAAPTGGGQPPASMSSTMFNFVDTEFAIGDAMALMNCQILNCAASCEHVQP